MFYDFLIVVLARSFVFGCHVVLGRFFLWVWETSLPLGISFGQGKWPMLSSCLFPFFYQVLTLVFVYVGGFGKLRGHRHGVASSTISFFVMLAQVPSSSFCLGDFQLF
ncbi:hypothetical protein SCA6_014275 [Theobroma cacao]